MDFEVSEIADESVLSVSRKNFNKNQKKNICFDFFVLKMLSGACLLPSEFCY